MADMRLYTKQKLRQKGKGQPEEQQTVSPIRCGSHPQAAPPYNQYYLFGGADQQRAPRPYLPLYGGGFAPPIKLPPTLPPPLQNIRTSELQRELEERAQELPEP